VALACTAETTFTATGDIFTLSCANKRNKEARSLHFLANIHADMQITESMQNSRMKHNEKKCQNCTHKIMSNVDGQNSLLKIISIGVRHSGHPFARRCTSLVVSAPFPSYAWPIIGRIFAIDRRGAPL